MKEIALRPKIKLIIIGVTVIFSVLMFPGQSFGWGNTWLGINLEELVNAALGKMGPFRYNFAFSLSRAGYDSDIYFGDTQEPVPDYTFTIEPQLILFLPLKNGIVFDISETPQYIYYLHTERERALNNVFQGRVHFAFNRLYFQLSGGLTNAKQRVTTEVFFNVRRKMNDLAGLAFWQLTKRTAIALQYRFLAYEYESSTDVIFDWEVLNRKENYADLTAYFQNLKRMRFFLNAQYGSFTFRETISTQNNSQSYAIYGGIEFVAPPEEGYQTRAILGQINLGYKHFDILDPQQRDYYGLVGNTNFSINISKFSTLRGIFIRDTQFSIYSDSDYYTQTIFGIGISRIITKRINLSYDFTFSKNDYVKSEESGFEEPTRRFLSHDFKLAFWLHENIELNLIATLGERAQDWTARIYRYYFIGFNLTFR